VNKEKKRRFFGFAVDIVNNQLGRGTRDVDRQVRDEVE